MVGITQGKNGIKPTKWYWSVLLLFLAIVFFLFAIDLAGGSLTRLGGDTAESILLATSNPFVGLFIGLLSTALIQSSSTVTAMTVAVVASGYLTLPGAIPIVLGANIGTTLTSTLVSLGFITKRKEFRKAISAGSIHDFFNIFTVVLLFPLEYYYGALSYISVSITESLSSLGFTGVNELSVGSYSTSSVSQSVLSILPNSVITILLSLVVLFISIKLLSKVIYSQLIGESKDKLRKFIFESPFKSFGWGTIITAGVQSSSITTSLMVPLVAAGRVNLAKAFPFIMGANIGTTITAFLAALNKTEAALSLAVAHLLINLVGVLIFLPFPILRKIPINLAYRFGVMNLNSRFFGFSYIVFTFFLLPFTLIYFNQDSIERKKYTFTILDDQQQQSTEVIVVSKDNAKNRTSYLVYLSNELDDTQGIALPDTSFQVSGQSKEYVTLNERVAFGQNEVRGIDECGDYTLKVINDTTSYVRGDVSLNGLTLLEKRYDSSNTRCSLAHFITDPESKILISAQYLDNMGKSIKSLRLESIR